MAAGLVGREIDVAIDGTRLQPTRDISLESSVDQIDMSSRAGGGFKQFERGLADITVEVEVKHDPTDAAVQSLINSARLGTSMTVDFGSLDEMDVLQDGWKIGAKAYTDNMAAPLTDASTLSFTLKPDTTVVPKRFVGGVEVT